MLPPTADGRQTEETYGSVRCLVGGDHAGGDAAALGDLMSVLVRPLAHGLRVHVALRPGGPPGGSAARAPATHPPTIRDVDVEGLAEGSCVLRGQVDLVLATVQ